MGWESQPLFSPQIQYLVCQSFLPLEPHPAFSLVIGKEGLDLEVLLE